jgi:hypothetical protein
LIIFSFHLVPNINVGSSSNKSFVEKQQRSITVKISKSTDIQSSSLTPIKSSKKKKIISCLLEESVASEETLEMSSSEYQTAWLSSSLTNDDVDL